ncbi:MAG TPA: CHAT domain-containing protein [Thermoanaerobaculia bacterium]
MRRAARGLPFLLAMLLAAFAGGAARSPAAAGGGEPATALADALAEGERRLAAGDPEGARGVFERALELAGKAEDSEGETAALIGLGDSCALPGEGDQALAYYRRALGSAQGPRIAAVRSRMAYVAGVRAANVDDDLAAAGEQFERATADAREAGDRRLEARSLHAQGNVALRSDDLSRAWDLYSAALSLATEIGNRSVVMLAERGLGNVEAERGRNAEALPHYEASLALARQTGNSRITEGVLNAIGTIYLEWADYGRALQYFQAARNTPTDDPEEVAYTLNNLGITYGSQGNPDLGLSYFRKALPLLEKAGDEYGVMRLLNSMGNFYVDAGQPDRALDHFSRGLRLAQKVGDSSAESADWYSLGVLYQDRKRYGLAADAYGKSLSLAESHGERNLMGQALAGLAHLHLARGEHAKAVEMADRAATVATETGGRETFWQARTLAGKALHALGRDDAAIAAYTDAIATVEQVRSRSAGGELGRETFFENRLEPYEAMIELFAQREDAAATLAQAERAKGRTLLEILHSGRPDPASRLTPEERAAETRLRDRLTSLNSAVFLARSRASGNTELADLERRLQEARHELEAFNTNLYATRPELRTQQADFPAWSLEATRGLLAQPGTALIEYAVLDAEVFLFVVTAEGGVPAVRLHRLPIGRRELGRRVEAFRRQLAARDLGFRAPARRLYDLLLAPAAAEIRGKRTLGIVPDGPLWDLPFQALQPSAAEMLLERHALYYAPSLSFLAELAARRSRPAAAGRPSLLAVGNPSPDPGTAARAAARRGAAKLAPLPDAEREVRSLLRLYGAERSAVYTAAAASERTVKAEAGKYRVLHFATHALLDDRNPLYSSLVLSRPRSGEGEDGLLEAWEMLGLRLDAELVVLSACDTARGRLRAGEGMLGMSWALAAAGSPAILASQWEVSSASTGELMVDFHRGWLGGLGKAEALRRAALAVRGKERYRHPFYWAGFVLVGGED